MGECDAKKIEDEKNLLSWDMILKDGQDHLDKQVFYNLTVRAFDGGNRQSEAIVQVLVEVNSCKQSIPYIL